MVEAETETATPGELVLAPTGLAETGLNGGIERSVVSERGKLRRR